MIGEKQQAQMLSIGLPSTLGNWHMLCKAFFGNDAKPTLFIKGLMDEQGQDEPVTANERQLLVLLGHMVHTNTK
jgi:hypothetical protein